MYSTSTNNLEKAYEELEREIIEIKQRLQASAQPNYPNERLGASLTQTRPRMQYEREGSDNLTQSIGSNLVGPGSASAARRRGGNARSYQRSPATRSGGQYTTGGGNMTNGQDLEEGDYSLSVSDLNSNSLYRSGM